MKNDIKYKFYLQIEDGSRHLAHPIYGSDTNLDISKESGYKFFRNGLSTKIDFILTDFDFILSAGYEDTIYFYIEMSTDFALTYEPVYQGKFVRTDCTIDYDNKKISVQPIVHDDYVKVIAGMDKEFDLIKLAPEMVGVVMQKRPMVQIYNLWFGTKLNCFSQSEHWEMDAEQTTESIISHHHFGVVKIQFNVQVTCEEYPELDGTYIGNASDATDSSQKRYRIYREADEHSGGIYLEYRINTSNEGKMYLYLFRNNQLVYAYGGKRYNEYEMLRNLEGGGTDPSRKAQVVDSSWGFLGRVVADVDTYVDGTEMYDIPSDDIVPNNRNYRYCHPYTGNCVVISDRKQTEPAEYGQDEEGLYYLPPQTTGDEYVFYPLEQSHWGAQSYWFFYPHHYIAWSWERYDEILRNGRHLRDTYLLSSCIQVLLTAIGSDVTHEATEEYSRFLYADTNPLGIPQLTLTLTQITNITRGEYSVPAKTAKTTLGSILKMLQNVFGLYWYIEDGKLKIEHITWYLNGGSYAGDVRVVGYDLTTLQNVRNGKTWAFGQSVVTYDKAEMPKRVEYSWGIEAAQPFNGYAIDVQSKAVDDGKVDKVSVSGFCSDVDYLLMNGQNMGNEGLVLMACTNAGNILVEPGQTQTTTDGTISVDVNPTMLPHANYDFTFDVSGSGQAVMQLLDEDGTILNTIDYTFVSRHYEWRLEPYWGDTKTIQFLVTGNLTFTFESLIPVNSLELPFVLDDDRNNLQNGYASFWWTQQNLLLDEMPARNLTINGKPFTARNLTKKKKQDVRFPAGVASVDTNSLVKTLVGIGEITKISLNLSSRIIKATLAYDTDS